ncbi:hypothetical protein BaRGS_00039631 [Batillaria attramentaria]|uniref:Uncharacterized protein n=1 Tax=Batillaria attramentaria TaxID=370345 RepID=A0ABD0J2S8_9CAEN
MNMYTSHFYCGAERQSSDNLSFDLLVGHGKREGKGLKHSRVTPNKRASQAAPPRQIAERSPARNSCQTTASPTSPPDNLAASLLQEDCTNPEMTPKFLFATLTLLVVTLTLTEACRFGRFYSPTNGRGGYPQGYGRPYREPEGHGPGGTEKGSSPFSEGNIERQTKLMLQMTRMYNYLN